jgi:hypothetical protein
MIAQPFTVMPHMEQSQLLLYECSDRIVLPRTYIDSMSIAENDLLMLSNIRNQSVYGTVFGAHSGDDSHLFIPSWMIYSLDLLHPIQISHLAKHRCSALQIKPHSCRFRNHPNFIELLNRAIQLHRSLTKGTRIPLLINDEIEYLFIENALPSEHSTFFVHNCGGVDIQILKAFETEEPSPTYLFKGPILQNPMTFIGRGYVLGGAPPLTTPQEAAAAAARKRMNKK